ncbi:substrate-binding periplasmic protein [Pseudodesulfovibrio sp.]|uniref:substrate-binding periplasmic protein n=1 Tax=unclassified Pseudodesulfovibrio TaxID=2661612 RepID=UPI003B00151C
MSSISRRQALRLLTTASATLALAPTLVLADDTTVVCGWNKAFPPFSMQKDGEATGILVDCMNELLCKRMGLTVHHTFDDWPKIQDMARTGKVDTLCTNPTDPRREFMLFCEQPVVESLPALFRTKDNPRAAELDRIASVEGLRNFRQVDYAGNGWAHKTFPPELHITWVDTLADALDMVAQGKADFFLGNSLAAMYVLGQKGLKGKFSVHELSIGEPSSFHFGLRRDFPGAKDLVERFSDALTHAISQDLIGKIIMKYM